MSETKSYSYLTEGSSDAWNEKRPARQFFSSRKEGLKTYGGAS